MPMVEVETRPPEPFEARSELAVRLEMARLVEVELVVVLLVAVKFCSVVDALNVFCPVTT